MENQSGFTLIETLIVLFIFISVTAVVLVSFQSIMAKKQTDYFLAQLQKDLYFSQEYAITHAEHVYLTFDTIQHQYIVSTGAAELLRRSIPNKISISGNFGTSVTFNPNGNISRFGTLVVQSAEGRYRVVFHIGKGRFYVKK